MWMPAQTRARPCAPRAVPRARARRPAHWRSPSPDLRTHHHRAAGPASWCRRRGAVRTGGRVICAGLHMSDIPAFLAAIFRAGARNDVGSTMHRQDGQDSSPSAPKPASSRTTVPYPLICANTAADRCGRARRRTPLCWCPRPCNRRFAQCPLLRQRPNIGDAALSNALGRFCCRSPLKLAATRDLSALR